MFFNFFSLGGIPLCPKDKPCFKRVHGKADKHKPPGLSLPSSKWLTASDIFPQDKASPVWPLQKQSLGLLQKTWWQIGRRGYFVTSLTKWTKNKLPFLFSSFLCYSTNCHIFKFLRWTRQIQIKSYLASNSIFKFLNDLRIFEDNVMKALWKVGLMLWWWGSTQNEFIWYTLYDIGLYDNGKIN